MFTVRIIRKPSIPNEELLIVEAGGTYRYHWALKGLIKKIEDYCL
jgi:hypothetical protein